MQSTTHSIHMPNNGNDQRCIVLSTHPKPKTSHKYIYKRLLRRDGMGRTNLTLNLSCKIQPNVNKSSDGRQEGPV